MATKTDEILIKKIAKRLLDNSVAAYGKALKPADKAVAKTDLGKKIVPILQKADFGSQTDAVHALMSAVCGEDLGKFVERDEDRRRVEFVASTLIVPVKDDNNHNYGLGKCVFVFNDGDICLRSNWTTGNHLTKTASCLRLPTLAEAEDFVRKTLPNLKKFFFVL